MSQLLTSNAPVTVAPGSSVRWIGGSPCAGKSTIAKNLARRFQHTSYHADDHFDRHARILGPADQAITTLLGRSIEDRLSLPVEQQVDDEFAFYQAEFPLIVDDLARIDGPVIAEAAALLPSLLHAGNVSPDHAIWLVPTEAFQRRHYAQRQWAWNLLKDTSEPDRLFDRWMARDARFATRVLAEANALGYRTIVVDGTEPPDVVQARVADVLMP